MGPSPPVMITKGVASRIPKCWEDRDTRVGSPRGTLDYWIYSHAKDDGIIGERLC